MPANCVDAAPPAKRLCLALLLLAAVGAKHTDTPRAKPPRFSSADRAVFFDNAFAKLQGPRPEFAKTSPAAVTSSNDSRKPAPGDAAKWSRWISTDTLETEIKQQARVIAEQAASSTVFKSGGYWECRDAFSMLAVMFAISADHDERARWRDAAHGMSSLVARAAANCKRGTDNTYREASARAADLADMVRGGRPDTPPPSGDPNNWGRLADRGPLMVRMDLAWQDRLGPLIANDRTFKRGAEKALHEAQVLAALAEVLTREGFDDADDEDYNALSRRLRDAATDIARAAEQEDYATARDAFGRIGKSCSDCHDAYRG